jgi:hypothetical protein
MLSAAKHLQCLLEIKQLQILRFTQNDRTGGFSSNLVVAERLRSDT